MRLRASARACRDQEFADGLFILAEIARVAHHHGVPLATLHRGGRRFARQRRLDHLVGLADAHAQPRGPLAIEPDFEVGFAPDRIGDDIDGARDPLDHRGDLIGGVNHLVQVAAQDADADCRVHPRGQHVHPVLDRHGPDVRPARHLHRAVKLAAEARQLVAVDLPEQKPSAELVGQTLLETIERGERLDDELGPGGRPVVMLARGALLRATARPGPARALGAACRFSR